jgi:hypothetical protein
MRKIAGAADAKSSTAIRERCEEEVEILQIPRCALLTPEDINVCGRLFIDAA